MNKLQLGILIILVLFLALRIGLLNQNVSNYKNGDQVLLERTLQQEPQKVGGTGRFSVFLEANQKVFITTTAFPLIHYGQAVRISGILKTRVIDNEKVIYTMSFPKIEAIQKRSNIVLSLAYAIRQKIVDTFTSLLPASSAGLLLGIVFGVTDSMSKEMVDDFKLVGMLHMVAASGMNVSLLGGFVSSLFAYFLKRQAALIATIAFILFYTLLAGAQPSIVRAAIMGILVWSAQIIGRQAISVWILALTGYGMLLFDPYLLSDIGFQLSFAATLGLLVLRPLFEVKKSILGEDLVTTFIAQLATLPIILANFGMYSPVSLLVNALALWPVPMLMVLGSLGALAGFIWQPLASVFLYLSLPLLLYIEYMAKFSSKFAFVLTFDSFPIPAVVGYYMILASFMLIRRKQVVSKKT